MNRRAFTLIELLVVISIIGLLSSVVLASLNTARVKARDARRNADVEQILTALNLFYDQYGCLPKPVASTCIPGYSEGNAGGWDYSSQGGFLTFLQTSGIMQNVPIDPINDMVGDHTVGQYAYRYYCYYGPSVYGLYLGYFSEDGGWSQKSKTKAISNNWADPDYMCK